MKRYLLLLVSLLLASSSINAQVIADFEDGTTDSYEILSWSSGITGIEAVADPAGASSFCMKINFDVSAGQNGHLNLPNMGATDAQILTYYVWLPADVPDDVAIQPFCQDNANWDHTAEPTSAADIPRETWYPVSFHIAQWEATKTTFDVKNNSFGWFGLEVTCWSGEYTGPVYIDNISFMGADPNYIAQFENGTDNQYDWWGNIIDIAQSVGPNGESGTLAVTVSLVSGSTDDNDFKGAFGNWSGTEHNNENYMNYYMYLPADTPDSLIIKVFAADNDWSWYDKAYYAVDVPKEIWYPLDVDLYAASVKVDGWEYSAGPLQAGVEFNSSALSGEDLNWSGTIYVDDIALLGTETGDKWLLNDWEASAGGTGGFNAAGWAPATTSLNWLADPTGESNGVLELAMDFNGHSDNPKCYMSKDGIALSTSDGSMTATALSMDVFVPEDFPTNFQFGLVVSGAADISGTGWLEYQFHLGTDSTAGLIPGQWNTMLIDIVAEAAAGNIDPLQNAGLGMQLYIADEGSYAGSVYFDNLIIWGIPAPQGTLSTPELLAATATAETDIGTIVNTVRFDWVDNTIGTESYNIYMSRNPITDLGADGVIKVYQGIPHGLQSYAFRPWTNDGGVYDYYFAITASDDGTETELTDAGKVGPINIQTSPTMKAKYVADFASTFSLDGLANEFEPYLEYQITPETAGGDQSEGWTPASTDLYFKTTMIVDDEYLYISADVTDDDLRTDEAMQAWEGDALEFYMGYYDAMALKEWHAKNYSNSNGDWRIGFTSRGEVALEAGTGSPDGIPGVEATVFQKFTGDGYIIEARLNLDSLVAEGDDFVVYNGMMLPCRIDNNDWDPTQGDEGRSLILQAGGVVAPEGVDMNEDWKRPHAWGLLEVIDGPTDVAENGLTPVEFKLHNNYPNPFNPVTIIKYDIPEKSLVTMKVFDILGREVATLVDDVKNAGFHQVSFDAGNLASGTYIYRITTNNHTYSKKMLLLK